MLSLLPRQTIRHLVAQGLLSRGAADHALEAESHRRSATGTGQPAQHLTERDLVHLMETFEGRPAWGTSLKRVNGRYRLQTCLPYAAAQ